MTRSQLTQLIFDYNSPFQDENKFKIRFLELLKDKNCFLRSSLAGHFTGSCWVTDKSMENVLLMHHAKLNKWLQPGGHADGHENLLAVAKKELKEETGLSNLLYTESSIYDLDIHTIPERNNTPEHFHYDVRFHFIADNPSDIQKNHESIELKWINLEVVHEYCGSEKSIMRMVDKTIFMNQKNHTP